MPSPNADKTLSPEGLKFIKFAEEDGGKPKLRAYDDGTGTATIGWGLTRGVTFGMEITAKQAEQMLAAELAGHIAEVHRLITRPISQGLFDALVSFFFNNGAGKCPTLLKAVNTGTDDQIRKAFMLYTKAYDAKAKKTVTWPGLVNRRAAELAHWAKMDQADPVVPTPEPPVRLPAPVEPPKPGWTATAVKSKSVMMQVWSIALLVVTTITDWIKGAVEKVSALFGVLPDVKDDVQSLYSTGEQMAQFFRLNTAKVVVPLVVVSVGVAVFRHVRDAREAKQ